MVCRNSLPVRALAFSPDGTRLAAAGDDNIVKLVDVAQGTVRNAPIDRILNIFPIKCRGLGRGSVNTIELVTWSRRRRAGVAFWPPVPSASTPCTC